MATLAQPSLFDSTPVDDLAFELETFTFNGDRTIVEYRNGVAYFFNEFWTARQRQAHSIHEISYRACFKPQLPDFFIQRLTQPSDTVYDPFMGRGTTPVQAALRGRIGAGNDVNPLSVLLTRPRISPPSLSEIKERLDSLDLTVGQVEHDELHVFYHPETLAEIEALRAYFLRREADGDLDHVDDWIRMVAINRLTGHSSGFFSVYSLPPNQAVSAEGQRKINEKRGQIPPRRSVKDIIFKKSRTLFRDRVPQGGEARLLTGDATNCGFGDSSVDLVVTSPPFLDIVQYASDNWLRCWFAGIDASKVDIAMHRKAEDWTSFTHRVLADLARVTKSGGHVAFEVGEVRNGKIELDSLVLEAADGLPFDPVGVVVNVQEFTKTANCWGVSNNAKGTNTNRIVLLRRI
ncbi:MAG: DNA methyltransferase [Sphingomonas sp.]|nr:DNA methyltransferase [Sphingomonas sp.]MDX3886330.1 DNA methyltransferase [Sphingomonas sp.]